MDAVRGKLLIASPGLTDFFRRTVVLMLEHTDEGALGLVLNKPSDSQVGEVVPNLAELADPQGLVHIGGPVAPDTVIVLARFCDPGEAASLAYADVGVVDPDGGVPDLLESRVYAGHAGWAAGQLETELEHDAWIVEEPADGGEPFEEGDLWSQILDRKGGGYALLARMPEDPSLN